MLSNLDKYGRFSLDLASTATTIGFSTAKACTRLGFSITRGVASTAAGFTGSVIDYALFGGTTGAGQLLGGAVSSAISAVEFVALAPLILGESLTSTSLVAAHSSLSMLTTIFPGSDEASFSLASFVGLVRREWNEPAESEGLPEERYGLGEVLRALAGFAALQGVTSRFQEERWFKFMKEVPVHDGSSSFTRRKRVDSRVTITGDTIYPSHSGQIVTADITEVPVPGSWPPRQSTSLLAPPHTNLPSQGPEVAPPMDDLKQTLRRLSKLVLAGYGGPSLLFFGVSLTPWQKEEPKEEVKLADAIDASEKEAAGEDGRGRSKPKDTNMPGAPTYSWWDVLMGKHDHDIFMHWAQLQPTPSSSSTEQPPHPPPTAHVSSEHHIPRFWVLTDHVRKEVVLVIRGTMSLNELAVDLTCDPAPFTLPTVERSSSSRARTPSHLSQSSTHLQPDRGEETSEQEKRQPPLPTHDEADSDELDEELENIPGSFPFPIDISVPFPRSRKNSTRSSHAPRSRLASEAGDDTVYIVHGGMLRMTRAMGGPGKPVHYAVRDALRKNKGYSLVLCGHSLGAGVAGLLALLWATPETCLTHRASGLPVGRRVSAYCFAPPCLVSPRLSAKAAASGLITSFVNGHDIVSRLSLGSVRDLTRGAVWLCAAENRDGDKADGYSSVTKKALKWKMGRGEEGDEEWFLAIRKTLEANMQMADLFPPGRVYWALRDGDLHRAHQIGTGSGRSSPKEKVRLFEVKDVKQVFGQIIFARDMLSSHLPHQYDQVLHELL
ncbi:alpha/beta-hydrolase [Dichomitus squalens]|uniref:sn-1-specific diacylglycerol lipase n=1 Tax=Dichomitus squalens TaxID=114155 RepID=A0A4Q9MJI8_9APHY|nr:alpha/beta-hydrolase [Dichomitus squalens LYAD-421 SS1]EJF63129.1 alpha/beta-hydrolase [Dichomitus squalens LYAD-421 SS1]TBU27724.1 alpha/beta-hydrolase [Dichomitus squalens]TBU50593.1 alpha/beta-hydrolase [Dichomitus squalens]TBU61216.1 alpha/beta-hydrolase [Dichomitus squalens]